MTDEEKDNQDYSLPMHADEIGRRGQDESSNLKGKGQSREGMIRFQKIQMKIEDLFDNEAEMMEILGQSALHKYIDMHGKSGVESVYNKSIESNFDQNKCDQEDKQQDDFLRRNSKHRKIGNQGVLTET